MAQIKEKDITETLIGLSYDEEVLWNCKNGNYKNRDQKSKAVERIEEKLSLTCLLSN